jgi:hypothetical protein
MAILPLGVGREAVVETSAEAVDQAIPRMVLIAESCPLSARSTGSRREALPKHPSQIWQCFTFVTWVFFA